MVAKFKKCMYLCWTRAFVFNFKELRLFVFKEQTMLIQLQERFIDSRMLYWFKKIIFIQQSFVFSRNLHSLNKTNKKYIFFQDLEFPVSLVYLFNKSSSRTSSTKTCIQRTWPSLPQLIWNPYTSFNFLDDTKFLYASP